MVLILLKVYLMAFAGILNFYFMIFIEEMCVVTLVPAIMTIKDSTFHPL